MLVFVGSGDLALGQCSKRASNISAPRFTADMTFACGVSVGEGVTVSACEVKRGMREGVEEDRKEEMGGRRGRESEWKGEER